MSFLTSSVICSPALLPIVNIEGLSVRQKQYNDPDNFSRRQVKCIGPAPSGFRPLCMRTHSFNTQPIILDRRRRKFDSMSLCVSALEERSSGASQTQTVTKESSTQTVASPAKGKLDPTVSNDGPPLPPDGGSGSGGGGGGGGGFFFFGFLVLLAFIDEHDIEEHHEETEKLRKRWRESLGEKWEF